MSVLWRFQRNRRSGIDMKTRQSNKLTVVQYRRFVYIIRSRIGHSFIRSFLFSQITQKAADPS